MMAVWLTVFAFFLLTHYGNCCNPLLTSSTGIDIFEDDTRVVTQRHRTCKIHILASEIVIYIHAKDFDIHAVDTLKVKRAR